MLSNDMKINSARKSSLLESARKFEVLEKRLL